MFICGCSLLGCRSSDGGPSEARKTQDAALKDPFGYNPTTPAPRSSQSPLGKDEVDPTDISGGGTADFDRKAMRRDLDAVFGK